MSIALDIFRFTVLLSINIVMELSRWIGVVGFGCPISVRVSYMFFPSCAFMYSANNCDSTAEATTCFNIVEVV